MARKKGSRKALEENKNDLYGRLAYDILSVTLKLCGLPERKLKSKERKKNTYDDDYYEFKICLIVFKIALSKRDEWKMMFESRFKSAGKDMLVKINDYLKSFLAISREFQHSNTMNKVNISLAAYSEMALFLNYKNIEFDLELMIISWKNYYLEVIAPHRRRNEPYQELFNWPTNIFTCFEFMKFFLQEVAIPYGRNDDVSETFHENFEGLIKQEIEKTLEEARRNHFASQTTTAVDAGDTDQILPPGFESPAVLPGDRESPEPWEVSSTENVDSGEEKKPRIRFLRKVWPRDFLNPPVLKPEFRVKKPRKPSEKQVEPLDVDMLAVLPNKIKSPEPPKSCIAESAGIDKDKESSKPSNRSKDVMGRRRRPTVAQFLMDSFNRLNMDSPQEN